MTTAAQTTAAEATVVAAAPALTKQEILRNTLVNFAGDRIALVTKEGDLFVAKLADIEIARVKRCEDLAGLLIDHRYTQKAKWAAITELKFECEVPAGTPTKAGQSKKKDRVTDIAHGLVTEIEALGLEDPAALKKVTKDDLVALLTKVKTSLTAA